MILKRMSLEAEYYVDMITHNGFRIENEDVYSPTDPSMLVNSSKFTDNEFRCDCGAFTGQDIVGQKCPLCGSEIALHSLNFRYTGWVDIYPHRVIAPAYYHLLKRAIGQNMINFILGNYKADNDVKYNENDVEFEKKQKTKKRGRVATNDIANIIRKIPQNKHQFKGIGHDAFYQRFEEVLTACDSKPHHDDILRLLENKNDVFTSKIPIYSTAFRPTNTTSESKFYPTINRWLAKIVSLNCQLKFMTMDLQIMHTLNCMQNNWLEAVDYLVESEMDKKTGFIRSEIVGGPFQFSSRAVITLDPSLNIDEVDLPYNMLVIVYQFKIAHMLKNRLNMTLEQACLYVKTYTTAPEVVACMDEIIGKGAWCVILREPTNNLASIELVKVKRYKADEADDTVSLTIEVLQGLNADFDGDQLDYVFLDEFGYQCFKQFMYSCMMNYVTGDVEISLREWFAICAGRMSE
jgi:DNA-directed RNA polymerase beta' subunit